MKLDTYEAAVKSLTVKDLGEILAANSDIVEIEDWSSLRAPMKREQFVEALKQSMELRKKFVTAYAGLTGTVDNWLTWEDLEDEPGSPEPDAPSDGIPDAEVVPPVEVAPEPAKGKKTGKGKTTTSTAVSTTVASAPAAHTAFVEGAFEQIVADAAGLDAQQSTAALRSVEEDLEFQHIKIGVLLGHIQKAQHYLTLGYENMRAYLEAETALHYRKAMQLIQNAETIQTLNIPASELKGVTWSALRHVLPVLNATSYKTWLEAARSMKHVTLIAAVNQQKVTDAGALPPPPSGDKPAPQVVATLKQFNLFPDQKEVVEQALEKAKVAVNNDNPALALETIAASYIGAPLSASGIASVMPDLSPDGFRKMFTKVKADAGDQGAVSLLNLISEIWPHIDISADFPATEAVA